MKNFKHIDKEINTWKRNKILSEKDQDKMEKKIKTVSRNEELIL